MQADEILPKIDMFKQYYICKQDLFTSDEILPKIDMFKQYYICKQDLFTSCGSCDVAVMWQAK